VLEPFANSYNNIVKSLENVGYVSSGPNQSLWIANWDWRLPVASVDANALTTPDGMIAGVTGASISDNTFETGVDYLGAVLKQIKTLLPAVTKVDVIAHSTGGIIARSYIQSSAYGASFGAANLPTIDDLILAGVPNEGVADPWSFSVDDFSASAVSRGLAMVIDRAYDLMVAGTPINGPDGVINNPSIPKDQFVKQYVASLRNLLPTYNAIDTNSDGFFEKIKPNWVEQGPRPVTAAQVVVPPNNQVNGAVEAVAFHPTNRDIAYAGTVNGGVWRTDNFQVANPTWVPLTDNQPSLSIGSIAFSPLDSTGNTLFVGTGNFSNGFDGDFSAGLLRTTDGGKIWSNTATASAFGGAIRRILPTSIGTSLANQIVLVAAADGILRSTDGGQTFTQLGAAVGLPTRPASDIIADPNNFNRFYAAIPDDGVFLSTNGGANWSRIDHHVGFSIAGITGSTNIELAVHDAGTTSVLYVGVVDDNQQVSGVFRDVRGGDGVDNDSANGIDNAAEFQFTVIGTVPNINNGNQGINNFAIVADPTSPTEFYIGGDQPSHLFRGDAATNNWTSIVTFNANDSIPHADTRFLALQDNTTLVTADDGGIYRLNNPLGTTGTWASAGGNLNAIEFYSLAYDTTPGLIFGGTQDNGSIKQTTRGSQTWNRFKGGDGGFQAYDRFTGTDYALSNNFGRFERFDINGAGSQLALGANANDVSITNAIPGVIITDPIIITSNAHGLTTGKAVSIFGLDGISRNGFSIFGFFKVTVIDANTFSLDNTAGAVGTYGSGSTWRLLGLDDLGGGTTDQQFAVAGGFAVTPMVTNAVRGNSILFGRRGLYESATSRGDTIVSLTSLLSGKAVNERIESIAYGGRRASIDRPGVFYVGTELGQLYVRDESNTVTLRSISGATGRVRDIAVDPDDWQRAYVVQGINVYVTVDAGANWTTITDNLLSLTISPRTVTLASNTSTAGDGQIIIGGLGGVFRRSTSSTPGANWSIAADGLPNVLVKDIIYERTNDTLYAGTFGRGAWSLSVSTLGNNLVNDLMVDLNGGTKNAWLNSVGRTNVFYSTEVETTDRIVQHQGPDTRSFLKDRILSFDNYLGRRPNIGETWFETIASGHGGDGTVSTFSSIDPFLGDPNIGSKLILQPITGAAAGTDEVSHGGLVNHPYSQTQILNAIGASNFANANLETTLEKTMAGSAAAFLTLKI